MYVLVLHSIGIEVPRSSSVVDPLEKRSLRSPVPFCFQNERSRIRYQSDATLFPLVASFA